MCVCVCVYEGKQTGHEHWQAVLCVSAGTSQMMLQSKTLPAHCVFPTETVTVYKMWSWGHAVLNFYCIHSYLESWAHELNVFESSIFCFFVYWVKVRSAACGSVREYDFTLVVHYSRKTVHEPLWSHNFLFLYTFNLSQQCHLFQISTYQRMI